MKEKFNYSCEPFMEQCMMFLKASARVNNWPRREWLFVIAVCSSFNSRPIQSHHLKSFSDTGSPCIVISHHDLWAEKLHTAHVVLALVANPFPCLCNFFLLVALPSIILNQTDLHRDSHGATMTKLPDAKPLKLVGCYTPWGKKVLSKAI